jgi:hypothetical protein
MRQMSDRLRRLLCSGLTLLAIVPLLAAGCAAGGESPTTAATVAALVPQMATAAGAAATAQVQSEASLRQAATAQVQSEASLRQAATAQSDAGMAVAQAATTHALVSTMLPRLTITPTPTVTVPTEGAAPIPLRRGLGIITRRDMSYGVITYAIDNVDVRRTPQELQNDRSLRHVELVLAEVTTGTFMLRYNAQSTQLAMAQPDRWSGFTAVAPIQVDADGTLNATSGVAINEIQLGPITATAPFTQTLDDGTVLSVGEVVIQLNRENVNLRRAYILLIDRKGSQINHILVTFFDPGGGVGGSLFDSWCQTCIEGVCRVVCG